MWMQIEFVKTSFLIEYWHLIELDYFYIDCQWPWMHLILKKNNRTYNRDKKEGKKTLFGVHPDSQFSCSVMPDSSRPHGLQHTRITCPSPTLLACSKWCQSQWCRPNISSSVVPFSSFPRSLPASGSFPVMRRIRWPKHWSFSFNISPSN